MCDVHIIRLRGPWMIHPATEDATTPTRVNIKSAGDWAAVLTDLDAPTRLERRFHCPTGLDDRQQVWLVIEGGDSLAVELNQTPIDSADEMSLQFDITTNLMIDNQVAIVIDRQDSTTPTITDVRLEIRTISS